MLIVSEETSRCVSLFPRFRHILIEICILYETVWFWPTLSHTVSAKSFQDTSRPMYCRPTQMGPCQISSLWMWPTADHEPCSQHISVNRNWSRSAVDGRQCTQLAGATSLDGRECTQRAGDYNSYTALTKSNDNFNIKKCDLKKFKTTIILKRFVFLCICHRAGWIWNRLTKRVTFVHCHELWASVGCFCCLSVVNITVFVF